MLCWEVTLLWKRPWRASLPDLPFRNSEPWSYRTDRRLCVSFPPQGHGVLGGSAAMTMNTLGVQVSQASLFTQGERDEEQPPGAYCNHFPPRALLPGPEFEWVPRDTPPTPTLRENPTCASHADGVSSHAAGWEPLWRSLNKTAKVFFLIYSLCILLSQRSISSVFTYPAVAFLSDLVASGHSCPQTYLADPFIQANPGKGMMHFYSSFVFSSGPKMTKWDPGSSLKN